MLRLLCWCCPPHRAPPPTCRRAQSASTFLSRWCDNDSQGIVPVGGKIGNGDDPENNLYWGCSDGLKSYFSRSSKWALLSKQKDLSEKILRRYVFEHKETKSVLVADAYRGSWIRACLEDFLGASGGGFEASVEVPGRRGVAFGGAADLIAYIGHNGLMEHTIAPEKEDAERVERDAVVLACCEQPLFRRAADARWGAADSDDGSADVPGLVRPARGA